MSRLSIQYKGKVLKDIPVHNVPFSMGRDPNCNVFLQHSLVSRRHAEIHREGDDYYVTDLESRNGTFVNKVPVERHRLREGDVITIGKFWLRFSREAETDEIIPGPSVVQVQEVSKEYKLGKQIVTALKNISLTVGNSEFLAIAGPSGSGKTTLLNLIGCIDTPTQGSIIIAGEEVSTKTPDELADLRASTLGFIFQTFNLLPVLSAWENVEYPLLQHKKLARKERQERVQYYLDVVGLGSHAKHRPNELSGGQRQRIAIARALATQPSFILADEPTANLDHKTGEGVLELMKGINRDEGTAFIFSTHDPRVIEMADRVISISTGKCFNEETLAARKLIDDKYVFRSLCCEVVVALLCGAATGDPVQAA